MTIEETKISNINTAQELQILQLDKSIEEIINTIIIK